MLSLEEQSHLISNPFRIVLRLLLAQSVLGTRTSLQRFCRLNVSTSLPCTLSSHSHELYEYPQISYTPPPLCTSFNTCSFRFTLLHHSHSFRSLERICEVLRNRNRKSNFKENSSPLSLNITKDQLCISKLLHKVSIDTKRVRSSEDSLTLALTRLFSITQQQWHRPH